MKRLRYFSSFNEDHIKNFEPQTTERPSNKNHVFRLKAKDGFYRLEILHDKDRFKLWVPFADDALTGKRQDLETREEFYKGIGNGEILPWILGAFKRLTNLREQEELTTSFEELVVNGYTYLYALTEKGTIKVIFPPKTIECDPEDIYLAMPELMVLPELHDRLRYELLTCGLVIPEQPYSEILRVWDKNKSDEK
jgi:hypothetical protein